MMLTVFVGGGRINKNKGDLLNLSKKVSLKSNVEKTKYMFRHQITEQNCYIKVVKMFFENFARFKYLGSTVPNKFCIYREIKSGIRLRNFCSHTDQLILSSHQLSKNVKIEICLSLAPNYIRICLKAN
jgi:hypothetical protein